VRAGRPPEHPRDFIEALGEVAENDTLQPAFRAQVLALPGEADVAREIGRDVDPDAIARARNGLRAAIADTIGPRLTAVRQGLGTGGKFSPDSTSAGRRSLRNIALDLSVANRDPAAMEEVRAAFDKADNMTDRTAALSILVYEGLPGRQEALDAFYKRFENDALVLDKWFSLQALTPAPETLDRVRELMSHPAFSISNPNRVRSLIGGFASGNQTEFNRADGAGYDFVADFVLGLDPRNPQTAARLLISFRSWRALEAGRRAKAETALRRIADTAELSSDTRDIITRTLA
jgi:aminopeptidase N